MNTPDTVGVPLIVIVPDVAVPVNTALTPAGSPVAAPIPVATVVVWVMFGVSAELMHSVGEDDAGVTVQVWAVIVFKQYTKQIIKDMNDFFFNFQIFVNI